MGVYDRDAMFKRDHPLHGRSFFLFSFSFMIFFLTLVRQVLFFHSASRSELECGASVRIAAFDLCLRQGIRSGSPVSLDPPPCRGIALA